MQAGDIALVNFPFSYTEATPYKKRPVLILGSRGRSGAPDEAILVAMITGNAQRFVDPHADDVPISDWAACGLLRESACRTTRLWTAQSRDFDRRIGSVSPETLAIVRLKITQAFNLA